jgi:hypothetical protein
MELPSVKLAQGWATHLLVISSGMPLGKFTLYLPDLPNEPSTVPIAHLLVVDVRTLCTLVPYTTPPERKARGAFLLDSALVGGAPDDGTRCTSCLVILSSSEPMSPTEFAYNTVSLTVFPSTSFLNSLAVSYSVQENSPTWPSAVCTVMPVNNAKSVSFLNNPLPMTLYWSVTRSMLPSLLFHLNTFSLDICAWSLHARSGFGLSLPLSPQARAETCSKGSEPGSKSPRSLQ